MSQFFKSMENSLSFTALESLQMADRCTVYTRGHAGIASFRQLEVIAKQNEFL